MTEKLKNWSSISTTIIAVMAAFYSQIAPLWGLPFEHQVTGTLTALATAIAGVLGAFTIKKVIDANGNGIPDDEETLSDGYIGPETVQAIRDGLEEMQNRKEDK